MKKLFTLLTMLVIGISGMWADFSPKVSNLSKEYYYSITSYSTRGYRNFTDPNDNTGNFGNGDSKTAANAQYYFEAGSATGKYYIRSRSTGKYWKCDNSENAAVTLESIKDKATEWVIVNGGNYVTFKPANCSTNLGLFHNYVTGSVLSLVLKSADPSNVTNGGSWWIPEFQVAYVKAVAGMEHGHIYTFRTKRNALTWSGSGTNCVGATLNSSNNNHRFVAVQKGNAVNGNFYLFNIGAEKYATKNSSGINLNNTPTDNGVWTIKATTGNGYPLMIDRGSAHFNFGSLGQITVDTWSTADDGNQFEIMDYGEAGEELLWKAIQGPKKDTYYTIKNYRSSKYAKWAGDNTKLSQSSSLTDASYWFYDSDGKLHNLATDNLYNSTNSFTESGAKVYIKENPYNHMYLCISTSADLSSDCWDDQDNRTAIGTWQPAADDYEGTSWTFEAVTLEAAKSLLNSYLSTIKTRYIDKIGDGEGQFTQSNISVLKDLYDAAESVYNDENSTPKQILDQYKIVKAFSEYPVPTPVTLPTEAVQIRSNYSAISTSGQISVGDYIVMADNDVTNTTWMKWTYKHDSNNEKFKWIFIKNEDNTFSIQNVSTEKYVALASNSADNFTMTTDAANAVKVIVEKASEGHYYIYTTGWNRKYLHARALEEYLKGQSIYYIGGNSEAYWIMPVDNGSENSCNDWNILVLDNSAYAHLGEELNIINTLYISNIGVNPANYTSASAADLKALYDDAKEVYEATEGEPDYNGAYTALIAGETDAIEKLERNGFSNEYVYTIKNQEETSAVLYYDGSNHYANAKNYNTESDKNASNQWAIVTRNGKKYVYNIYAGEFLHGKTGIQSPYSWPLENKIVNAIDITLQDGIYAGTFKLRDVTCTDSYDFMHCNNSNYYYGTTNWCEGSSSSWYIEKVNGVTLTSEEQKEILDKIVTGPIDKAKSVLDKSGNVGYPAVSSTVATELESAINAVKDQSDDYTTVTDEQLETVKTKLSAFYEENSVVLPEDGKAYRISIYKRGSTGAHWNYNADGTRNDGSSDGGTFYVHRISKNDNTRFVLISTGDGKILKSNGVSDHYSIDYAYNDFEVASLNSQSENGNMLGSTSDQRCGYVYMTADARNGDHNNRGNLVVQESNGNTSDSDAPFFNGSYTSAIKFTEVVDYEVDDNIAKVVAQIDALVAGIPSGYTLGEGVGTYFYMNGETKITSDEDYISAINSALSADDVDAIKNSLAINMPAEGFYRFKAAARSEDDNDYNWYIGGNADGIYAASTAKDQAPGANTIFYLENDENGYHLLNYSSGRYSTGISYNAIGTKSNFTLSEGIKTNNTDKLIGEYRLYNTDNNWVIAMWNDGIKNLGNENDWEGWTIEPVDKLPLTLAADSYTSFSAPVPVTIPEGEDPAFYAYIATSSGDGVINMQKVTGDVAANTGLIISTYGREANPSFDIAADGDTPSGNMLKPNWAASKVSVDNYFFAKVNGKYMFTKVTGDGTYYTLPGHKAYLQISGETARMSINWGDDNPTGIEGLQNESVELKDGKYYQNGKVVVVRNGVKYNVAGQIIK